MVICYGYAVVACRWLIEELRTCGGVDEESDPQPTAVTVTLYLSSRYIYLRLDQETDPQPATVIVRLYLSSRYIYLRLDQEFDPQPTAVIVHPFIAC
jgi:hypothetical protein